ncbi:MAG: hypothetical protein ACRD72_25145 [Candidatus Angelobacter sp.]
MAAPTQEAAVRFWTPDSVAKPDIKQGMMAMWAAKTQFSFAERPTSYLDLAKVLFSEYVDDDPVKAKTLARHAITTKQVGKLLAKNSLEQRWIDVNHNGIREVRVVATTKGDSGALEFPESLRPSDKELYDLAVALRLGWAEPLPKT